MKNAKIKCVCISVECPHCEGKLTENNQGEIADLPSWYVNSNEIITCEHCGKDYKIPASYKN